MNSTILNDFLKLEQEASLYGFKWPDKETIFKQITQECLEIKESADNSEPSIRVQEEVSDLLHASISLCLFFQFDLEKTLSLALQKFKSRMNSLRIVAQERGLSSLNNCSMEEKLNLWKEAKNR